MSANKVGILDADLKPYTESNPLPAQIIDSSESVVDSFGEPIYPSGSGSSETVSLTTASTVYAVPTTAPSGKCVLVLYNDSDVDVYWSFVNSASGGVQLPPDGKVVMNLGANQQVYVYCGTDGKTVVVNYKLVE